MSSIQISSKTYTQAAKIAEQIESLQKQLSALLERGDAVPEKVRPPAAPPKRRISAPKKPSSAAPKATGDGRGTLRPAVVAILKKSEEPLKTAQIYDALVAQGYTFTFKDAKKVLGIRLYKMLGVQPLGGGLFKAK
jgi:hypothetical protein